MKKPYKFGYWRENSFDENKAFKVVFALISQFISSTLKAIKNQIGSDKNLQSQVWQVN